MIQGRSCFQPSSRLPVVNIHCAAPRIALGFLWARLQFARAVGLVEQAPQQTASVDRIVELADVYAHGDAQMERERFSTLRV